MTLWLSARRTQRFQRLSENQSCQLHGSRSGRKSLEVEGEDAASVLATGAAHLHHPTVPPKVQCRGEPPWGASEILQTPTTLFSVAIFGNFSYANHQAVMDDHSKTMSTKNETPAPGAPAADAESRGTKRTADDNAEQSSRSTKKKWDKDERKTYHKGDRKGKGRNLGRGEYLYELLPIPRFDAH
jgi:hypothetical protein